MASPGRLKGLFRSFRSFVLGREVEVVGQCKLCGNCCHDILLRDGGWIRNQRQFDKLCDSDRQHRRFEISGKDDHGRLVFRCVLQGKDGLCTSYNERLPLCRSYPSKTIYYRGGWIGPDCGFRFKTVKFRDIFLRKKRIRVPQFSEVLNQELKHKED